VKLRLEHHDDHAAIRQLHLAAFGDHGQVVVELVEGLRESSGGRTGLSLVAEDSQGIVGHIMFTSAFLDAPRQLVDVQVLDPLGVRPERQGEGIGTALIRRGLGLMRERDVPVVFVEGDPGYYPRLGFRRCSEQGFRRPSLRMPDAAFQAVRLPAYQAWMTGTLVYPDIFWRLDAVGLREA
jgi:putative acetyltransferase